MDKTELALNYKHSGLNCCQAVLAAYADELGLSEEMIMKLGAAFGAGMGGMDGTCGALCGAEMVLGLKAYDGRPVSKQAKGIHSAFRAKCGATICRDLKQIVNGKQFCSCDDCVKNAVEIIEECV